MRYERILVLIRLAALLANRNPSYAQQWADDLKTNIDTKCVNDVRDLSAHVDFAVQHGLWRSAVELFRLQVAFAGILQKRDFGTPEDELIKQQQRATIDFDNTRDNAQETLKKIWGRGHQDSVGKKAKYGVAILVWKMIEEDGKNEQPLRTFLDPKVENLSAKWGMSEGGLEVTTCGNVFFHLTFLWSLERIRNVLNASERYQCDAD